MSPHDDQNVEFLFGKNDEEEEEEGDINDNQQVIDHETHKSFKSGQPPSLWAAPFSLINLFCLLSPPHLFIDTQYNSSNQEILICNQVCSRELLEISRRTHSHTWLVKSADNLIQ